MHKIIELAKKVISISNQKKVGVYSGYATLYILMAMIPLLVLVVAVANMVSIVTPEDITSLVVTYLPDIPEITDALEGIIENLNRQSGGLLASISALTTLWSASNGVTAIQTSLQNIVGEESSLVQDKPKALLFTLLFILLLPAILVTQVLGGSLKTLIGNVAVHLGMAELGHLVVSILKYSNMVVIVATAAIVLMTYTWLPKGKRSLKSQLPGAVLTSIVWLMFSYGFAFFIPRFWKASAFYGSLAAVFLAAMWLKILIMILLYGAVLNQALLEERGE
ncbi:MAG: YihY/virulence factor BrkB family protein [Solobacterium sp.]|nr:YihY/virulence factor BrkB family protein [Solobacterium sp.]